MGSFRIRYVYFVTPLTPAQVVAQVRSLTRIAIGVTFQDDRHLTVFHPAHPNQLISLSWSTDRLQKMALLKEAIGSNSQLAPISCHATLH